MKIEDESYAGGKNNNDMAKLADLNKKLLFLEKANLEVSKLHKQVDYYELKHKVELLADEYTELQPEEYGKNMKLIEQLQLQIKFMAPLINIIV